MAYSCNRTKGRSKLNASTTSVLALATAMVLAPDCAQAESFLGTPTVTAGSATITEGATTTDIAVQTTQVVIDWVPDDTAVGGGNIDFQPVNTTATFTDGGVVDGIGYFAVLNRIIPVDPTRMVELNGTITSLVGSNVGGTIFFYSPGGILIGSSAVINVGSLGLTANDPRVNGGEFINAFNQVEFQQATQAGATVTTAAGSSIFTGGNSALGFASYFAMVAPVVQHGGNSFSNTAAAMISADAALITFSPDGLFDIQVTSGTSGTGKTLSVSGNLNTELGGYTYLAAVPKNDAITMAITAGAEVGFDVAQNATAIDASTVILGAGSIISDGNVIEVISPASGSGTVDVEIGAANIAGTTTIWGTGSLKVTGGANFRGTFFGGVQGTIDLLADTDDLNFGSTVSLDVGTFSGTAVDNSPDIASDITVIASNGNSISVDGGLSLRTLGGRGQLTLGPSGKDGTGGDITFTADGGSIGVNGNLTLISSGLGRLAATGGTSGDGIGGDVVVTAINGGEISAAAAMTVQSFGNSQASSNGGDGVGGNVTLDALSGGSITANRSNIQALGTGGQATAIGGVGGDGFGGTVTIRAIDGLISYTDGINSSIIRANGAAGRTSEDNSIGGTGQGGTINISASGVNGAISFANFSFGARANGFGGPNGDAESGFGANAQGGSGLGGAINVDISDGASLTVGGTGPAIFDATGIGGLSEGIDSTGGSATGGSVQVVVSNGASVNLGTQELRLTANAVAGNARTGGVGGNAAAGSSSLLVDNGSLSTAGRLAIFANAEGGSGGVNGGNGNGGQVSLSSINGGAIGVSLYELEAEGVGGDLLAELNSLSAGDGFGGTIEVRVIDALMQDNGLGQNIFYADGFGGAATNFSEDLLPPGITAGSGSGGSVLFEISGTNALVDFAEIFLAADGYGGTSFVGSDSLGGNGAGGSAQLIVQDSAQLLIDGDGLSEVAAIGVGGSGDLGGNGIGGSANMVVDGATADFGLARLQVLSDGSGGGGYSGGVGGNGQGGSSDISVSADLSGSSSFFSADSVLVESSAIGGSGMVAGSGTGGSASVNVGGDNEFASFFFNTLNIFASGFGGEGASGIELGGAGGAGGDGQGGFADLSVIAANGQLCCGSAQILADGFGGNGGTGGTGFDGGTGGTGFGGIARARIYDDANSPGSSGFMEFGNLLISAGGFGGFGGSGTGIGGDGGDGDSGQASLTAEGGAINLNGPSLVSADGVGGAGGLGALALPDLVGAGGNGFIGGDNSFFSSVDSVRIETQYGPNSGEAGIIDLGNAGTLTVSSQAIGGQGSTSGIGNKRDRAFSIESYGLLFEQGGSVAILADYDVIDPAALEDAVYFGPDSVTRLGALSITSAGPVSYVNEGIVNVGDFSLDAPDYVFSTLATPTVLGTTTFDNLTYFPAANIVLQSNFVGNLGPATFATSGDIFVGDVTTNGDLTIQAGGTITAGQINAGGLADIGAEGAIDLDGVNAASSLFIASQADISVSESLTSGGSNVIQTGGALSAGIISSTFDTLISALGGISLVQLSTGSFASLSSDEDISVGILLSDFYNIQSQGSVFVEGEWNGVDGFIVANDLVIEPDGDITTSQRLTLQSTNSAGTFIGTAADGTTGGFEISQVEFDSLSSPFLQISSNGNGPAGSFMQIGDLSVSFADPGATVLFGSFFQSESVGGSISVQAAEPFNQIPGTLLISGDIITTNAGPETELAFANDNVLIDAATGGIFSLDTSGNPSGFVTIIADRLLAAETSILEQLVEDPLLEDKVELINTPTFETRPEGILTAGGINLIGTTQVAIQNTGTLQTPAGFLVVDGFSQFDTQGVEFIVNGQIADGLGGVITGDAVAEIVFTDPDIPLMVGSTVNGCADVGQCPLRTTEPPPTPRPPFLTPTPAPQPPSLPPAPVDPTNPEVTDPEHEISTGLLPDEGTSTEEEPEETGPADPEGTDPNEEDGAESDEPGAEKSEEEETEDKAAEAPIEAPAEVIDFTGIEPNPDVYAPVSGNANPSLIGASRPGEEDSGEGNGNPVGREQ